MRKMAAWLAVLLILVAGCGNSLRRSALAGQGSIDAIAVDPQNPQIVYALQVADLVKSVDGGASWRKIDFPRTVISAFAFGPPRNLYVSGVSTVDVAFRSIDGGAHWRKLRNPFPTDANTFVVAPSNRSVLYAGTGPGVYTSINGGEGWRRAGLRGVGIDTLGVDPENPRTVYAVRLGGPFLSHVFKTTNGGRSWREIGTRSLAGEAVQTITSEPQRPSVLYAATRDGVYKSIDAGAHWQRYGLRDQTVNQVVVDPHAARRLYAATIDDGVFKSTDAGKNWRRLGLAGKGVEVLAISSDGRVLYAGTDDDGVIAIAVRRR
jgi:photosystem II stability/assembly factor-like uncharacterized protein